MAAMTPDPVRKVPMVFRNPIFQEGVNATVRKGTRWANLLGPESIFRVESGQREHLFDGFVIESSVKRLCDLQDDETLHHHDPRCRTATGLYRELKKIYGEKINARSEVSIVLFELCDPDPGEPDEPIDDVARMH
jgi:hypothetical protein